MISPDSHFNTISIISFSLFLSNAQFHTPHHHQGPIALSRYTNKCTNARESKSVRTKAADNYIPTLQYVSITLSLSLSLSLSVLYIFMGICLCTILTHLYIHTFDRTYSLHHSDTYLHSKTYLLPLSLSLPRYVPNLILPTLYIIPIHTITQKRIFCLSLSLSIQICT